MSGRWDPTPEQYDVDVRPFPPIPAPPTRIVVSGTSLGEVRAPFPTTLIESEATSEEWAEVYAALRGDTPRPSRWERIRDRLSSWRMTW